MSRASLFYRGRKPGRSASQGSARGFTLIELMIALVLGLVVIGGVISVFLAGQRSYATNKALGDVQDSTRVAFEMMARDIRVAGLTGCDNSGRIANVLKNGPSAGGTAWWANPNNAVIGYGSTQGDPATDSAFGTSATLRVSGTDSLMLIGLQGLGATVNVNSEPAGTFTINETTTDLAAGDVVIVCDPDHAAIVQLTSAAGTTYTHAASGSAPGNCSKDLSYPTVCSSTSSYIFAPNSQIAKLTASDWYVGYNGDANGGKSLYRVGLVNNAGAMSTRADEMVRGVTGMSLLYHQSGNNSFVDAASVTNWAQVDAVRTTLTLASADQRAGTDLKPITRTFSSTTTVRNRVK
ncbi:prepilin-type N-terminal cleavage/methylation domain-containing protein [Dyella sp.]|uniref:prepilin-type N-terminal cleavage/methylation domain-containing protein n=1 Tax=Dyella sp. TaxID=1869338 RepID=UPI003F81387A